MSASSDSRRIEKLREREYREAYVFEHIRTGITFQLRALRAQRDWTQEDLARKAGTTQTVISRVENPDYGRLSLETLLRLASAFDVALLVKFVPYSRLLKETEDLSPEALSAEGFEDEFRHRQNGTPRRRFAATKARLPRAAAKSSRKANRRK